MESNQRRSTHPAASPEVDRRNQAKADKEATDKEMAERLSSPPEPPTPTQEEADAIKSGEAKPPEARSGAAQERDVKPGASGAGYTTR